MDEGIGKSIRYHRIKQRLSQKELAKGIISISYLSKVEGGSTDVNTHIINLLCERLGISRNDTEYEMSQQICRDFFYAILTWDRCKANSLLTKMKNWNFTYTSVQNRLIDLHKLQYYLMNKMEDLADNLFFQLQSKRDTFSDTENFYWHKFSGNYYYSQLYYKKALQSYKKSLQYMNTDLPSLDDNKYELYYIISLTADNTCQSHVSLYYAERALAYYQRVYDDRKCVKCHIIIGNCFRRIKEFEKAIENYRTAKSIMQPKNDQQLLADCYFHYGKLQYDMDDPEKAIEYFKHCFHLRKIKHANILPPIVSLVKILYNKNDIKQAEYWVQKGLTLSHVKQADENFSMSELIVYNELLYGSHKTFEDILTERLLPFVKERQLPVETFTYMLLLATFYYKQRKYKLAAEYYASAIEVLPVEI